MHENCKLIFLDRCLGCFLPGMFMLAPGDWRGPDTVHVDSLLIARKP
jgi:hypothetical protein